MEATWVNYNVATTVRLMKDRCRVDRDWSWDECRIDVGLCQEKYLK